MQFFSLIFVTAWVVYFLHFLAGNILDIFYRLDHSKKIKIHFT